MYCILPRRQFQDLVAGHAEGMEERHGARNIREMDEDEA